MLKNMHFKPIVLAFVSAILSFLCEAQLYETPESRRQQAEIEKREQEKRRSSEIKQHGSLLEQKEIEARGYIGKTFWFIPNEFAVKRLRFYERIPSSSYSEDPNFLFRPRADTSFEVTGVTMPPPVVYPVGKDEYLLEIKFPDGKVGYVNVVGCCGIAENLYKGAMHSDKEYVSSQPASEVLTEQEVLREKSTREAQAIRENEERKIQEIRATLEKQAAKEEADRKRRLAMPSPRIGMTQREVVDKTHWGAPQDINRTTTARGVSEQWVYGLRRFLYFQNGVLTAIQD